MQSLVNHLTRQYSGGTEPYGALEATYKTILENGAKADIVLITDGVFGEPSEDFLKIVSENPDIKIYTISISAYNPQAEKFSEVITLQSLFGEREKLRGMVGSIV